MKVKNAVVLSAVIGFTAASVVGCGDSSNPKVIDAPKVEPGEAKPVPKDMKKGGGPGSSGNMNRNPGAST
jgi:hypothetical protein